MIDHKIVETIYIKWHLGSIRAIDFPLTLDISPLTVFIGPREQVNLSLVLVSQLLYFFRDAQYLISTHSKQKSPDKSVRKIIEGIRSGESSKSVFASFVDQQVDIYYHQHQRNKSKFFDWYFTCYENNRQIVPKNQFKNDIESWYPIKNF